MNNNSKTVAFVGVMSALMFVALFLETYVFNILIPLAPPCFLSLSLAITVSLVYGKKSMLIGGTVFGVCSFFIAIIIGNPVFILPWVSILPRVFIGVVAYFVYKLVNKFTQNSKNKIVREYLAYSIGSVFGVITNTVLVLAIMYFFGFVGIETIVATFVAINFPLEIILSAILVPVFMRTLKKIRR